MTTHDFQDKRTNHKLSTTIKELGLNITEDYHHYGILRKPDSISWFVDGHLIYTEILYSTGTFTDSPESLARKHIPVKRSELAGKA